MICGKCWWRRGHRFQNSLAIIMVVAPLALSGTGAAAAAPEIPGAPQNGPIALVGATIHPVSGPDIPVGTLVFDNGRIVAVGADVDIPAGARQIDVTGKHVYPSLFDANTGLGLREIGAVRATLDQSETGSINPNVRAQVAVNPDSELIPVTRSNGVLLALTAPSGGLLSGRSAVLQLDGWTYEDMTRMADVGLHVNWPNIPPTSDDGGATRESPGGRRSGGSRSTLDLLQRTLDDARAYHRARQSLKDEQPVDARWESLGPVLDGRVPLIVHADDIRQIQSAVAFTRKENLRLILCGGYDAADCSDLLRKYEIPVIVAGVYRLPQRRDDAYDAPYTLPDRLRKAGLTFCIASDARSDSSNVRNLPYHAATAAAYGLPTEEALKAITLYPAQILGLAEHVGSLQPGKDATLIVTDGDPLETTTHVLQAFIQGREVDLSNRHTRLWHKYQEKYRRQENP